MALDWTAFAQFEAFDCQRAGVKAAKLPGLELRVIPLTLPGSVEDSDSARRTFAVGFIEAFLPYLGSGDGVLQTEAQMFNVAAATALYGTPNAFRFSLNSVTLGTEEVGSASVTVFWRDLTGDATWTSSSSLWTSTFTAVMSARSRPCRTAS